jgi:hypothetical protein
MEPKGIAKEVKDGAQHLTISRRWPNEDDGIISVDQSSWDAGVES